MSDRQVIRKKSPSFSGVLEACDLIFLNEFSLSKIVDELSASGWEALDSLDEKLRILRLQWLNSLMRRESAPVPVCIGRILGAYKEGWGKTRGHIEKENASLSSDFRYFTSAELPGSVLRVEASKNPKPFDREVGLTMIADQFFESMD